MTPDRHTLISYFKGKNIGSEELENIHGYRAECIARALKPRITMPFENYSQHFGMIQRCFEDLLRQHFSGERVIELGPGASPLAEKFFEFGAKEYVGVEPFHPELTEEALPIQDERVNLVKDDGLTYLLQQPENSALVVSFGVLCPELLGWCNDDYYRFLGREIYKVTPEGNISIHVHGFSGILYDFFEIHGFRAIDDHVFNKPDHTVLWEK